MSASKKHRSGADLVASVGRVVESLREDFSICQAPSRGRRWAGVSRRLVMKHAQRRTWCKRKPSFGASTGPRGWNRIFKCPNFSLQSLTKFCTFSHQLPTVSFDFSQQSVTMCMCPVLGLTHQAAGVDYCSLISSF